MSGITAGLAVLFVGVARWVAKYTRRFGVPDAPISTFGGPAMLAAFFCVFYWGNLPIPIGILVGALAMALIGFIDDCKPFAPLHKLVLTAMASALAIYYGTVLHLTGMVWLDCGLTLLWMVWMCQAFNVFDMADGLSAGSGVVAFAFLWFLGVGDWTLIVVGALVGFLVHNFYPARIYMGDAGSLFFGFLLSVAAIQVANDVDGWLAGAVVVGLPNFEAVFISVMRFAKGRPISRASRDHVAQRLVQWGRSDRVAVAMIWSVGVVLGGIGVLVVKMILPAWIAIAVVAGLAGGAWAGLARVDMEGDGCDGRPVSLLSKNWLVHRLMRQAMVDVKDRVGKQVLDVGCGAMPYAQIFAERFECYVGMERDRLRYENIDVCGDAMELPFGAEAFDTVLCNQVLEHVPEPQLVMDEMARVLKSGGSLILTAPHIWGEHEIPHDYFRYTRYGLKYLAEKSDFAIYDVRALAGFWVTFGVRFCYYLARFDRGVFIPFVRLAFFIVQFGALVLDCLHRVESEAWNFMLVAQKA